MTFLDRLERSKSFWNLIFISLLFFLLRFPSLFEPNWYGDEGIYQILGKVISNGGLLYRDIWDNKPPLLYLVYSFANSDLFTIRFFSLIFGFLSVIVFYHVAKKLFAQEKIAAWSTLFFAVLLGLPLIEGNIANAENFMILPTVFSAFLVLKLSQVKRDQKLYFYAGLLLGISFLFKIVAIFDFIAFFLFLFYSDRILTNDFWKIKFSAAFNKFLFFPFGFLIPLFLTFLFFWANGAFSDFLNATFFSNIDYVGYKNTFIIPQGLLFFKLLVLMGIMVLIYRKRNNLPKEIIFIWVWFSFSLFNALFSQRPYTHYLLVFLPSFILFITYLLSKNNFRKLNILILASTLLILLQTFGVYGKTISYYTNFLNFIQGKKDVDSYRKFFDSRTSLDYELASFIKSNTGPSDRVFTWGNNAAIYPLSGTLPPGRFTVAYHITSVKNGIYETQKSLNKNKPKIIFIMPFQNNFPFSTKGYSQRMIIQGVLVYERIQ